MASKTTALALAALTISLTGCELFKTTDAENIAGRGSANFDPYAPPGSTSIRLALQMLNGCAILATGEPVGKGSAKIPYPDNCPRYAYQDPGPTATAAYKPMQLLAGASYFLNQLAIQELADGLHTDPNNLGAVTEWMRTQTRLKNLDWQNLSVISDDFMPSQESFSPQAYDHIVSFGNANWQTATNDTFLVEVLNTDGAVVQSMTYDRHADFLAENARSGHTQIFWDNANIGPPQFPGDIAPHPIPPAPPAYPPAFATAFRSVVRFEVVASTHPTKSFQLDPGLTGDGAIRVTWSQIPNDPFYFPVTFVRQSEVPSTCFKGDMPSQKVQCSFGLTLDAKMEPPHNGVFYVPGEPLNFILAAKDGAGNYLHPPDQFWSWNEYLSNQSNGLLYLNFFPLNMLQERDTITGYQLFGPIDKMRPMYELEKPPFWYAPTQQFSSPALGNEGIIPITRGPVIDTNGVSGGRDLRPPTNYVANLPLDAKPGTYLLVWKVHRQYMGERFTKLVPFSFQVMQEDKTTFPGRVGNCQICHRGTVSLENIRHGLNVDYIEACTGCHNRQAFPGGRTPIQQLVHQIHMGSGKFPEQKNDCTLCHLTRESAIRPSYVVCASCHPQPHGTMYQNLVLNTDQDPTNNNTVYGNCAQQCHGQTPPTGHILPAQ